MNVDVTMNGNDYTNDHVTYGYFDAFVIDVNPKLIPIQGGTNLTMTGFGFVDSEQGIKTLPTFKQASSEAQQCLFRIQWVLLMLALHTIKTIKKF